MRGLSECWKRGPPSPEGPYQPTMCSLLEFRLLRIPFNPTMLQSQREVIGFDLYAGWSCKKGSLSSARLALSRRLLFLCQTRFIRADAKRRLYKRDHANKEEIIKVKSQKRQTDRQNQLSGRRQEKQSMDLSHNMCSVLFESPFMINQGGSFCCMQLRWRPSITLHRVAVHGDSASLEWLE